MKKPTIGSYVFITLFVVLISGCSKQNTVNLNYVKNGNTYTEEIIVSDYLNQDNRIQTPYIDSLEFSILDSISFEDDNPDKIVDYSTTLKLNFNKKIQPYSPEYYSIATAHYVTKCINYYSSVFDEKIDFRYDEDYNTLKVQYGDINILTTPNRFIFKKGELISPSVFYHEIGHRAFWFMEDSLKVNFKGLSYIHMGLLEYFTVSLNNSPIVGENVLPSKLIRDASTVQTYPFSDSLSLYATMQLLKESFPEQMKDSTLSISKYYNLTMDEYGNVLKDIYDNHRTAMIITSTLWRIREKLGQKKTDNLVAQTILHLNEYQNLRDAFYVVDKDEKLPKKIEWYDLVFGLMQTDNKLFDGENSGLIMNEFKKTGFPIEKIKSTIADKV